LEKLIKFGISLNFKMIVAIIIEKAIVIAIAVKKAMLLNR
jgi:hypothetical protein